METILLIVSEHELYIEIMPIIEKKYNVLIANSIDMAEMIYRSNDIDAIIFDSDILATKDNDIVTQLRARSNVPLIVISNNNDVNKILELMSMGVDDYISRPLSQQIIFQRLNDLISPSRKHCFNGPIRFKRVIYDPEVNSITMNGLDMKLSNKEFLLFKLLLTNPTKIFTRHELKEHLDTEFTINDLNVINVYISNLRKKISVYDADEYIETIWGNGIRLSTTK